MTLLQNQSVILFALWKYLQLQLCSAGTLHYDYPSGIAQTHLDHAVEYLNASLTAGGGKYAVGTAIWISYQGGAQDQIIDPQFSPVPEPASMAMSGVALMTLSGLAWRRNRKTKATRA